MGRRAEGSHSPAFPASRSVPGASTPQNASCYLRTNLQVLVGEGKWWRSPGSGDFKVPTNTLRFSCLLSVRGVPSCHSRLKRQQHLKCSKNKAKLRKNSFLLYPGKFFFRKRRRDYFGYLKLAGVNVLFSHGGSAVALGSCPSSAGLSLLLSAQCPS